VVFWSPEGRAARSAPAFIGTREGRTFVEVEVIFMRLQEDALKSQLFVFLNRDWEFLLRIELLSPMVRSAETV
jgi:hypothetical protein